MPGMRMNDRQMKQAMKKMGIKQSSIDNVTEVIIRTNEKEIVIRGAEVICVEMGGSKSYQVSGIEEERMLGSAPEGEAQVSFPHRIGSRGRGTGLVPPGGRGARHVPDRMRRPEGCRGPGGRGRTACRGDHQDNVGVIEMCLAVPGKIVSIDGDMGDVDFGGVTRKANLSMVDANVGDWAVVHAGFAIQIMDEEDAQETLRLWNEVLDSDVVTYN